MRADDWRVSNGSDSFAASGTQERAHVSHRGRGLAESAGRAVHRGHRAVLAAGGGERTARKTGRLSIEAERAHHWLDVGAQPSDTVRSLLRRAGVLKVRHEARVATKRQAGAVPHRDDAERGAAGERLTCRAPAHMIVGRVRNAHGIRGEVVVESLTE